MNLAAWNVLSSFKMRALRLKLQLELGQRVKRKMGRPGLR
jgi:hypothetical protein